MGEGVKNPADVGDIEVALDFLVAYAIFIYGEVAGLDGDAMRGTDDAALASVWTAALATALANYTAVRAGYLDELDFDLQAALGVIAAYVDELETRLTAVRAGYLDQLDFNLQEAIAAVLAAERGTDNATLRATWTDAMAVALANYTAVRADYLDELAAANLPADITNVKAVVDANALLVDTRVMGRAQIAVHNDDLDSIAAGTYSLVTAVDQDVIIESLVAYCKRDLSGDAGFTGLSVQTDDTTNQVFISQADGVKANLTAESQLAWTGAILLKVGSYIDLSIYGGAVANAESLWDLVITYRAVVSGGYIA